MDGSPATTDETEGERLKTEPPVARWHGVVMAVILILVALYGTFLGDRIPIRDGRGWDGDVYVEAAASLSAGWETVKENPYLFQRLAPSVAINAALNLTGAPRDDATVIGAFAVLNLALLLLVLALWLKLAERLKLSAASRWLGFVGLFVNVQCFKVAFYYPALTDIPALALGMALVYFYLTERTWAVAATTLIGAFTWPVTGHMGALLVLFPFRRAEASHASGGTRPPSKPARVVAGLAALGVTAMLANLFYGQNIRTAGWGPVVPAVESVYPLSLLVTAAYVFLVVATLVPEPTVANIAAVLRSLRPQHVLLAIALVMAPRVAIWAFVTGEEWVTVTNFIPYTFFLSTTRPAIFLVGHLIFFGPVFLLLPWVWRQARELAWSWGAGMQLFLIVGLMVAACPDSRMSTLVVPAMVVLTVVASQRAERATVGTVAWLGALALVMSRIWLPFNLPARGPGTEPLAPGWDMSRYYETQGSYMTEPHYLAGLALAGVVLFLLGLGTPKTASRRKTAARTL